jgi:hypothetical protein
MNSEEIDSTFKTRPQLLVAFRPLFEIFGLMTGIIAESRHALDSCHERWGNLFLLQAYFYLIFDRRRRPLLPKILCPDPTSQEASTILLPHTFSRDS